MQRFLKTVAVRPKTDALRHYLTLEAEARADREIALAKAMRCAEFEARHTGPFNHSGKELKRWAP